MKKTIPNSLEVLSSEFQHNKSEKQRYRKEAPDEKKLFYAWNSLDLAAGVFTS
ncbi:MAG: hypothetical protein ACO1QB_05695 [Verrucomicrobiales bacterium]